MNVMVFHSFKIYVIFGKVKYPQYLFTAMRGEALKAETKSKDIHYLSKPIKPAKLKALLNHKRPA